MNYMYRYNDMYVHNGLKLHLDAYPIIKETKCGVWIGLNGWSDDRKFINTNARKQWAYADKEKAFDSFQHRKARQISILTQQLKRAKQASALTINNPLCLIQGMYELDY